MGLLQMIRGRGMYFVTLLCSNNGMSENDDYRTTNHARSRYCDSNKGINTNNNNDGPTHNLGRAALSALPRDRPAASSGRSRCWLLRSYIVEVGRHRGAPTDDLRFHAARG